MFGTNTIATTQPSLFGNSSLGVGFPNSTAMPSQGVGFGIVQSNQSEYIKNQHEKVIYVACKHHNHLLREVDINDIANYQYGYNCDVCKTRQGNISEKFFHCDDCAKERRYFDICLKCVRSCLQ